MVLILVAISFNSIIIKVSILVWVYFLRYILVNKKYLSPAQRWLTILYNKNIKIEWQANLLFLVITYKN